MQTKNLILTAGLIALGLVAAAPATTFASDVAAYREGMHGLLQDADRWNTDLDTFLGAVSAKPELACSAEFVELVNRGGWIHDDLVGTGVNAPRNLRSSHDRGTGGFAEAVEGARIIGSACDGSTLDEGRALVDDGQNEYNRGIFRVRSFTRGFRTS